jgi:hypothetical protein
MKKLLTEIYRIAIKTRTKNWKVFMAQMIKILSLTNWWWWNLTGRLIRR